MPIPEISKADQDRAKKIIGMLGSSHAGEAANAANFLTEMAKRYKLTMVEFLARVVPAHAAPPPPQPPPQHPQRPQRPQSGPMRWSNVGGNPADTELLDVLEKIGVNSEAFEFVLTQWECNFASDVAGRYSYDSELSEKQKNIVQRIVDKVRRANGRS
jgi:hypothetical protein